MALALLVTLFLGGLLTLGTMGLENRAEAARFDRMADMVAGNLRQRMVRHVSLLRATASLMTTEKGAVSPAEFASYVGGLRIADGAAGIQGIGFAPIVSQSQTADAGRQLSELLGRPYVITAATAAPEGPAIRAPVALLEPRNARNAAAIGFDLLSEPVRRTAILATLRSGEPRATGPIQLVQEITPDKQTGFLILLRTATGLEGVTGTGEGVIYAPFRAGDLFQGVLAQTPELPLTVSARDVEAPDHVLFDNAPAPPPAVLTARAVTRTIDIAGRRWQLTMTPTATLSAKGDRTATLYVGLLSLLLLAAVGAAMESLRRSLDAAHRAAAMAERQAADRALMLREMQHRIKNHIARIQAIARQSVKGAADLPDFERIFSGRLAAMAKAQDALVAGNSQQADLRQLLRTELEQVLDGAAGGVALDGPDLRLGSRETQAIGLVAHELVTNTVKYGTAQSGSGDAGGLALSWRVAHQDGRPWLTLDWIEPGSGAAAASAGASPSGASPSGVSPSGAPSSGAHGLPPLSSNGPSSSVPPSDAHPSSDNPRGFGTQLIEALIEGDLGGSFSRVFDADGMRITLRFPLSGG